MTDNKSKILLYSIAYYPFVGGAEVAWREITDRIEEFEFDMITPLFDKKLPEVEKIGNINIHRIGFGLKSFDKIWLIFYGPIKGLLLHSNRKYSATIGIMYNQAGLAASLFKLLSPKIPFILNLQDGDTDEVIDKKTRGIKFITKIIYKKPNHITVIANFLKNRALENGSTKDITIIPNGVNTILFEKEVDQKELLELKKELQINEDDFLIITTSRLNYKNAIDDLIQSLSFLPKNYKLFILGVGEEENKLKQLVQEKNLSSRVHFLGYKQHTEMIRYLKISHVFCRPSLQEGLGNSFLEAMMAGLPVVATPVGGIPDFLEDGKTGLFCEVKNPKSIAEKIQFLSTHDEIRTNIIKNAIIIIKERFDWDLIAKKYNYILKNILQQ
ncbi:MAG: glycosyltransferase family 4 protein [Candidatus Moranbacteria bacterium]|nr:glycosyltransferase family 4 protein [Candidatus Moranbacteria bacterium]